MKTYVFIVTIDAKNEEVAKEEFSSYFGYDFDSMDNYCDVDVFEKNRLKMSVSVPSPVSRKLQ